MTVLALSEACERIDYGLMASADHSAAVGPRFLRITDIEDPNFTWDAVPRCSVTEAEYDRYALSTGDVVVARTGASTGRSAWVKVSEPSVFASYLVRFRAQPSVDGRFLGYVLRSSLWNRFVAGSAHGKSAQPNLSAGAMATFEFDYPDLTVQRAIAEVLGALDDKIAANRQAVSVAASLAIALFEGSRRLDSYETAIADVTSMVTRGITPRYTEEDGFVVLNQKCVRGQRVSLAASRLTESDRVRDEKRLRPDDVLVNSTGQGTLGRVARWSRVEDATVDSHISIVRFDRDKVDPVVAGFGVLVQESFIEGLAEGSTGQTELSRGQLSAVSLRLPPRAVQTALGARLAELDAMQLAAEAENDHLATLRDTLLPQLMSGKIRVKDAEKLVEDVV